MSSRYFWARRYPILEQGCFWTTILAFMPSPDKVINITVKNEKKKEDITFTADKSKPFAAQIFKTIADPFVGKLSILKVISGTLKPSSSVENTNKGKHEKFGSVYSMVGKKEESVEQINAGRHCCDRQTPGFGNRGYAL